MIIDKKVILVTGGLGYIGSHTILKLLEKDFKVVCVDNLSNSQPWIKDQVEKIAGKSFDFHNCDVTNFADLKKIISNYKIDTVIHFAAFKAVNESINDSLKYYENNLLGLINILKICNQQDIENFIFSSSATVYGNAKIIPVNEDSNLEKAITPYGETKLWGEDIVKAWLKSYKKKAILLRYFNPIGGHNSGTLGELPNGVPNNLIPYITQTAIGKREKLFIFGNDYNTSDGSCIRDFIDVNDLAAAHVKSINYFEKLDNGKSEIFCLGTGKGNTVLEIVNIFEKVNQIKLNYEIIERREGDVEAIYCDNKKAVQKLGWNPEKSLEESLKSAFLWEKFLKNRENGDNISE